MKWINRAVALAAVLALSAVSVWAQAKECNDEFKTATYLKWYENRTDRQDVAYEAAKEYLAVCTDHTGDQYAAALKKFVEAYDKLHLNKRLAEQFDAAVKAKNYADQIRVGKQLTAIPANADNAGIYIVMAGAGLGDPNQLAESSQAAKKAIELIEQGKPFTPFYQTKDQALAGMTYVVAKATMKTSPTEAIPLFVKALKFNSDVRKSPAVYNELATAYGEGPVAKYAKEYQDAAAAGKSVDSPEVKLIIANLNQALDRQIDAFARAAASAAPADKKQFMDVLAAVYKDRNKKDAAEAELNSMVASALSTPVPDAPTPITTVPTTSGTVGTGAAPGGTPAGSAMNGNGSPSASSTASKPASSGGSTTTKPATSPKPKPRRA
jgi:hypothetical protein